MNAYALDRALNVLEAVADVATPHQRFVAMATVSTRYAPCFGKSFTEFVRWAIGEDGRQHHEPVTADQLHEFIAEKRALLARHPLTQET
nr:hypothetical protein [uncultured Roseateles sp.]